MTDSLDIKRIINEHYEKFYTQFDNPDQMDQLWKTQFAKTHTRRLCHCTFIQTHRIYDTNS